MVGRCVVGRWVVERCVVERCAKIRQRATLEGYLAPHQTSGMEFFAKIVKYFAKKFHPRCLTES